MTKPRGNALCFVQFLHPGEEHKPDNGLIKKWNKKKHKRKFMRQAGTYIAEGKVEEGEIVFWGEWESESTVLKEIDDPIPGGPRFICEPYYVVPESYHGLQNTDPFVFGTFLYGNCLQYTSAGPTRLRYLDRGSVILFGSRVGGNFVLDTVFVIDKWIKYDANSYGRVLKGCIPHDYMVVTLNPLFLSGRGRRGPCPPRSGRSYRLYFGATHAAPVNGIFSFFPCIPSECAPEGFARPIINDRRFITSNLPRGKRLNCQADRTKIRDFWDSVVDQVLRRHMYLGIQAQMPERRCVYP